jgi:5'-nucleotidase
MKRRNFVKQLGFTSTLATLGGVTLPSFTNKKSSHITILHTNDTHSHIEPFDASHYRYANRGGVAKRATLVEQIRKENENTLLLDAGDIFQGTPY